jgi:ribosomal protein L11 methyltransferase
MLATNEGGCLVDVAGLDEMLGRTVDTRDDVRAALVELLDAGCERCAHGLPLWVDLAAGEPFEPRPGFRLGADFDLLAGPVMGAGRAPWTRAGLAAIERCGAAGRRVADVGAGSGILGFYALRLGAVWVDAVDVDPLAVAIARRNARANGFADRHRARVGSVEALSSAYDLLLLALPDERQAAAALPGAAALLGRSGRLVVAPAGGRSERIELEGWAREVGLATDDVLEEEGWEVLIAKWAGA